MHNTILYKNPNADLETIEPLKPVYISHYLSKFNNLNITMKDYIEKGHDLFIKDNEGKTLFDSWLTFSIFNIESIEDIKSFAVFLSHPHSQYITDDNLKIKINQFIHNTFTFVDYSNFTEEQKRNFVSHFILDKNILGSYFTYCNNWYGVIKQHISTSFLLDWFEDYHIDFKKSLELKDERNYNLAFQCVFSSLNTTQTDEVLEHYFNILDTIKKHAPHLFNDINEQHGSSYEYALLKKQECDNSTNNNLRQQTDIIFNYLFEQQLDCKLINKKNHSKKKI